MCYHVHIYVCVHLRAQTGKYIRFIGGRDQVEPYVFRTISKASFCAARILLLRFSLPTTPRFARIFFSSFLREHIYSCLFPFDSRAHRGRYVFVQINVHRLYTMQ